MARLIETTRGHEQAISKLMFLRESNRLPQSLAFVGPSGVGKKRVALALAQALVCENSSEACGHCGPCLRIEKQQSESLILVQPDPEYAKPQIKVDDIRQVLEVLSLASIGAARIVILDQAHLMNDQAANALLKNLEEPTDNVYFILIANEIEQLLPTIRSRVQVIRFSNLTYDQIRSIKPNLPDWAYRCSRGQLDRLESLTSKDGVKERQESLNLFSDFCFNEEFLLHDDWRKSLREDRTWALFNMKCWLQLTRDALMIKAQTPQYVLNTDQSELLKQLDQISFKKLSWLARELIQATRDINANQDSSLVVDSLKVNYARVD
ncbi:MAG: DNA polymerase III subunit [Pseudobdellovibrio sp.]